MKCNKFRAWHKKEGQMYDWNVIVDECDVECVFGRAESSSNYCVMQHTGLRDENGVEIYEGDVCKLSSSAYYSNPCFSCDENWELIMTAHMSEYMYVFSAVGDRHMEICFFEINNEGIDVEVIGNIHEHPELLEKY